MISKFKQSNSGGYTEVFAWGDDQYGQLGVSGKNNSKIHLNFKNNPISSQKR